MTSQQFLVCDCSTVANFKSWASALSNFIRSAGWTNSSDTGQLNGAGAGNWAGVSTVPGSGAFYYEVFQPGDGLQNFYLKVEYGNASGSTNAPTIAITLGTTTNGAGTLTGFTTTRTVIAGASFTAPSTTVPYECDFSGDSGRLSILLWRNAPNNAPQLFAVQRSLNASGSPYGTSSTGYVSQWSVGGPTGGNSNVGASYQSLGFLAGPSVLFTNAQQQPNNSTGWPVIICGNNSSVSSLSYNGAIPVWNLQPVIGVFDYPCTVLGLANGNELTEGVPFTITNQYGQAKTYMPTKAGLLQNVMQQPTFGTYKPTILVEYD